MRTAGNDSDRCGVVAASPTDTSVLIKPNRRRGMAPIPGWPGLPDSDPNPRESGTGGERYGGRMGPSATNQQQGSMEGSEPWHRSSGRFDSPSSGSRASS